jgi:murein DD-endopeptidase MepM/ murein hydrolase activator NlpD
MSRRWKYISFSLAVCFLLLAASFLLFSPKTTLLSKKGGVFDESQYLFSSDTKTTIGFFDTNITGEAFLQPGAPPFLISSNSFASFGGEGQQKEIREYLVKEGDTLNSIAEKFNISLETVLWANNLSPNSIIKPGQKLIILPVSGVLHIIRQGDTLSELAELYHADVDKIVEVNGLESPENIYAGDILIIPGGRMPKITKKRYAQVPISGSYFICPIASPCKITQGLHWFNAVDISNGMCGGPVFAAAGGTVQRTGYNRVSGYYVRVIHPNGVVTFYGHLSKIAAKPGQKVYQGQIIGYVGHTGITIPRGPAGCHVHFDVRFAKNPFAA